MNTELLKVSLRQGALYLPDVTEMSTETLKDETLAFVAEMRQLGYTLSEPLLHAVNSIGEEERNEMLEAINDILGTKLNWASLVKGWTVPTGETRWDHFVTFISNVLKDTTEIKGTTLPCGHLIPENTFPLERYNGCPFCGKVFRTADFVYKGQGNKLKLLNLWNDNQLLQHFQNLLQSPVPLDATQLQSLKTLLKHYDQFTDFPPIKMKETLVVVINELVSQNRNETAGQFFTSPADILRYLWYRHTGYIQLIKPSTLLGKTIKNHRYEDIEAHNSIIDEEREKLKLKYSRSQCKIVAQWLNQLQMPLDQQLEIMHTNREMWVRFIRALRLAEYAKKPSFEQLKTLMERFYHKDYTVWQGQLDGFRRVNNGSETLRLLSQRPGLFARCLFSTMLSFGYQQVTDAFLQVISKVPPRLLLSLGAQAELWFDHENKRCPRTITGTIKEIPPHPLLSHYKKEDLQQMKEKVCRLYLEAMRNHFALPTEEQQEGRTIYIDPQLFDIPVSVGDRSTTIQDTSCALQGQRFKVKGDKVRLFMQWGKDLPEQWLDMDLSCYIICNDNTYDTCAYFRLTVEGAQHSGDIRHIPNYVGTAEYIELSLPDLIKRGAQQVIFTCNAYSPGEIAPNLMVGWMSAEYPMSVSEETGVAYDPSTVDHVVRISEENLSEGLVFGVLDVNEHEITWLEAGFDGQTVLSENPRLVNAYLQRLRHKPSIGQVLTIKAEAQHLNLTNKPQEASEAYTLEWAKDAAAVSKLLLE